MPWLNPEAGAPPIQLVKPETTKEELPEIYLEVYKLHRLPGSPPGEPAILEEIMASIQDHPQSEEDKTHEAAAWPLPGGSQSSRSSAPHWERRDDSIDKSLATICRAHEKALAAVATLEEEINRMSHTQAHLKSRARSNSKDCQRPSGERRKRCHQVRFADEPTPSQSANPKTPPGEEGSEGRGSDLEEPPELKPTVASFLQGLPPADSIFAYRDIREIPQEKVVVYMRALQHWVEQNNLPAGGEPRLLAKSILELRGGGEMVPLLHG